MHANKWTLRESLEDTKRLHPDLCPNKGFFWQMQQFEHQLLGLAAPTVSVKEARPKGWCSVGKFKESMTDWKAASTGSCAGRVLSMHLALRQHSVEPPLTADEGSHTQ